jgi:hypothetical protein
MSSNQSLNADYVTILIISLFLITFYWFKSIRKQGEHEPMREKRGRRVMRTLQEARTGSGVLVSERRVDDLLKRTL